MKEVNNINELSTIIVDYINKNKSKYNINYEDTIDAIKEVIDEIENDYKALGDAENE